MKRAFTLVEMMIVIIIISIITTFGLPSYHKMKKTIEYKEASGIVGMVRAAAGYYYMQYGDFDDLQLGAGAWDDLNIEQPDGDKLTYEIADDAGVKYIRIRNLSGDLLYSYKLPNGPRETIPEQDDMQYLPEDLP
jgi:prepilin-type N-terminal cleavage/methylation domain-containing protein